MYFRRKVAGISCFLIYLAFNAEGGWLVTDSTGYVLTGAILIGAASTFVGIPLWVIGGSRNARAEVALQNYNILPEGSMTLGVEITIRF